MNGKYLILDNKLGRIGTLSTDGATPFYNDEMNVQIADPASSSNGVGDSLSNESLYDSMNKIDVNSLSKNYGHSGSIYVPYGYPDSDKCKQGNNLAYYDETTDRWYVMYIWQTDESELNGSVVIEMQVVNLFLYDISKRIPKRINLKSTNLTRAFSWFDDNLGWKVDINATSALTADISFDGKTNAYNYLQTMLTSYDIEVDAYVKVTDNGIQEKILEVTDHLNDDVVYAEVSYGKNLTGITRTTVGSTIVTKLYPYGGSGENIGSVNNGKTYLVDDDANEAYNPDYENSYLEAEITSSTINRPLSVKAWGKKILALYNHPRVTYTVNVSHDFNPPLGATIRVKDFNMTPEVTVESRVIQKTISVAHPENNTVTFGEFVTIHAVAPSWLVGQLTRLRNAVDMAKQDASAITTTVLHPDGVTFGNNDSKKRLIMEAKVGSENISAFLANQGFIWKHLAENGGEDSDFQANGYLLNATKSQIGTMRARVNNAYIVDDPEVSLDTDNAKSVGTFKTMQGSTNLYATQYIVRVPDGRYITSHHHGSDTWYALWSSSLQYQSKMIVTDGGHGSAFGVEQTNGKLKIWANTNYGGSHWVSSFVYQGGKTLGTGDIYRYLNGSTSLRVNYDPNHDLIGMGLSDKTGKYMVLTKNDVLAKRRNILYSANIGEGHGFDAKTQTYQSQCLDFPYLYFHSGNVDMFDERKIYAINLIHQGDEFQEDYDFSEAYPITNPIREPEGISLITNSDGSRNLLLSFNTLPSASSTTKDGTQCVFSTPLIDRPAAEDIDTGTFEEVD